MKKLDRFIDNQKVFRCPICRGKLNVASSGSLRCKKKHCFDIAAKGYINFLAAQGNHPNKYDKELFECRNRIFTAGFYEPVLEEIKKTIYEYLRDRSVRKEMEATDRVQQNAAGEADDAADRRNEEDGSFTLLDVGCGEGFYASWLSRNCEKANVFGLDIVKEAIQIACRDSSDVTWIVGNLADIPLFNGTFDVLLNVLTPANYKEFNRIMKREGILIKVVPGKDYLKEIRQCVADQLINKDYSNDSTVDYFKENMCLLGRRSVSYTLPVTPEQAALFLRMTPMTFHVNTADLSEEKVAVIKEITIHLELLIGRQRLESAEIRGQSEK